MAYHTQSENPQVANRSGIAKKVKVGFDKIPAPLIETFPELVDIQGLPLTDVAGNRLITSVITTLDSYNRRKNALSVVANNDSEDPIPTQERFSAFSEVSVSLLGVTRAEEQLSLFSDVSSYGIDNDQWNYYTVAPNNDPPEWYTRRHPIFGERSPATFYEGTEEQALYIKSFPVQYTYPYGPSYTDGVQTNNFYKYIRFIALGRWLYEVWQLTDAAGKQFGKDNFIPPYVRIMTDDGLEVPIVASRQGDPNIINSWLRLGGGAAGFYNETEFYDIEYRSGTLESTPQQAMNAIENWTAFYEKIRSGTETYPIFNVPPTNQTLPESYVFDSTNPYAGNYSFIKGYCEPEYTRPGDSDENTSIGILESKKTFRYQPGRISGFTFGLRLRNNPGSTSDKIEWGAANPTDQYMFQVSGTQWSIVVRSTVQRPIPLVENYYDLRPYSIYMYTDENGQPAKILPPGKDNSVPMYELTIPRSKWNGDPLDGSGESGYIIDFEKVTMYKIEYSWYGAIGARFYAYVPVGAGEARWVRLHTMIIENQMDRPVLQNPDFKFRYMVYNNNTANMLEPVYIYKYGASYYIDGGDEGTTTFSSLTADEKQFTDRTPIVGIHPKNKLINTTGLDDDGNPYEGNINLKQAFPRTLSIFSDVDARIDVEEVKVSPDGQHGSKSISLSSGELFEKDVRFSFVDDNSSLLFDQVGTTYVLPNFLDYESKLIVDNGWVANLYTKYNSTDPTISKIFRRQNYELVEKPLLENLTLRNLNNAQQQVFSGTTKFTAKLNSYKSFVGSDIEIRGREFKVHFLNPIKKDGRWSDRNFADFLMGFTTKKPELVTGGENPYLKFGVGDRVYTTTLPADPLTQPYWNYQTELYAEFTNRENKYEITTNSESDESDLSGGFRFEQDERIRGTELPQGSNSGFNSCLKGKISFEDYAIDSFQILSIPDVSGGTHRIIFTSDAPPIHTIDVEFSDFSIDGSQSSFTFTTVVKTEEILGIPKKVVYVRDRTGGGNTFPQLDGNGNPQITELKITTRELTISDDYKLTKSVDEYGSSTNDPRSIGPLSRVLPVPDEPVYLFIGMRSNALINNIIVEEEFPTGNKSHIPNFVGTTNDLPGGSNIQIIEPTGVSYLKPPSSFVSEDRLSAIGYDTSSLNPIRDGKKIYSFFVPGGKAEKFNLEDIFNFDRATIATGLYNNNAIYFRATALNDIQTGNMRFTVTTREQ